MEQIVYFIERTDTQQWYKVTQVWYDSGMMSIIGSAGSHITYEDGWTTDPFEADQWLTRESAEASLTMMNFEFECEVTEHMFTYDRVVK